VPEYQLQEGLYEYSSELCIYLRQLEERFVLHKDFLEGGSINQGMRAMVVNWIIEVRPFPEKTNVSSLQIRHPYRHCNLLVRKLRLSINRFKFAKLFFPVLRIRIRIWIRIHRSHVFIQV
jgi:hypothetical protein